MTVTNGHGCLPKVTLAARTARTARTARSLWLLMNLDNLPMRNTMEYDVTISKWEVVCRSTSTLNLTTQ